MHESTRLVVEDESGFPRDIWTWGEIRDDFTSRQRAHIARCLADGGEAVVNVNPWSLRIYAASVEATAGA